MFSYFLPLFFATAVLGQSWVEFQRKHVLNPNVDPNYATWNRASWNNFLRTRLPSDYGTKTVNSILVKNNVTLLNDFTTANPPHNAGTDFHWSSVKEVTYVLQLSGSSYNAYRCPNWYVLARLDTSARPMHYHGYSNTQPATGQLPLNLSSCLQIS